MDDSMPVIAWSSHSVLMRLDAQRDLIPESVDEWMGLDTTSDGLRAAVECLAQRRLCDNEVVRKIFIERAIAPQDWMVRGALAHYERRLEQHLKLASAVALPGIERAITNLTKMGAAHCVVSWGTERSTLLLLRSARLTHLLPFEGPGPGVPGVFSTDCGDMHAILKGVVRMAQGRALILVTGSVREAMVAAQLGIYCVGIPATGCTVLDLTRAGAQMVVTERTGLENLHRLLQRDKTCAVG